MSIDFELTNSRVGLTKCFENIGFLRRLHDKLTEFFFILLLFFASIYPHASGPTENKKSLQRYKSLRSVASHIVFVIPLPTLHTALSTPPVNHVQDQRNKRHNTCPYAKVSSGETRLSKGAQSKCVPVQRCPKVPDERCGRQLPVSPLERQLTRTYHT